MPKTLSWDQEGYLERGIDTILRKENKERKNTISTYNDQNRL